jgi:hypothetical protein
MSRALVLCAACLCGLAQDSHEFAPDRPVENVKSRVVSFCPA